MNHKPKLTARLKVVLHRLVRPLLGRCVIAVLHLLNELLNSRLRINVCVWNGSEESVKRDDDVSVNQNPILACDAKSSDANLLPVRLQKFHRWNETLQTILGCDGAETCGAKV